MTYSSAEQEAINLCIVLEALKDIVNHLLLDITFTGSVPREAEVRFESYAHQELFLVRVLDFAKEHGAKRLTGIQGSCVDVIGAIRISRAFDRGHNMEALEDAVDKLQSWFAAPAKFKMWLPSMDVEVELQVPRLRLLSIIANQFKHNLSRTTKLSEQIVTMLADHGHNISFEQAVFGLDDFREQLQSDYFAYYATWITELLNEVVWGIHIYLKPVFKAAFVRDSVEPSRYRYQYPENVNDDMAQAWFWRLMNHIRSKPYVPRFQGSRYLRNEVLHDYGANDSATQQSNEPDA